MRATPPLELRSIVPGIWELSELSRGDARVCVAVLDGPVHDAHTSLVGARLTRLETVVSQGNQVASRHGTHVTSLIFGQRDPVLGIAPHCRGLLVPVFGSSNGTIAPCSQVELARAMLLAIEHGANVINISGGEVADSSAAHPLLADAVRQCLEHGALIVAAAGDAGSGPQIPGDIPGVLAVCPSLPVSRVAWSSRAGQRVFAPGNSIPGASVDGGVTTATGSSFSTAIVSGVAAVLLSIQIKLGRRPDAASVRRAIIDSAWQIPSSGSEHGHRSVGELNIGGALQRIAEGVDIMSESASVTENGHHDAMVNLGARQFSMPGLSDGSGAGFLESAQSPATTHSATPQRSPLDSGKPESGTQPAKASCGCGCSGAPQLVYALGQLGYDFGSEARRDSIMQHMAPGASPHDPRQLLAYFKENPWDAASVTWTLSLDNTPIYGVKPAGPFAREICERLREFLGQQLDEGVERVSLPGQISGAATLMNGQVIPLIVPELRGMYSWTTKALVEAVCGTASKGSRNGSRLLAQKIQAVGNFVERVYHESRNLGVTAIERAMNYAATNALNFERVFESALKEDMELEGIDVERSPVCRADSDCWDVKLLFFYPKRQVQTVRKVYRFTVDVSDLVPVMVGQMRSWFVR
jgi:cyanobactin maturation PatA/PatG family protease